MGRVIIGIVSTTVIIYVVPIVIYGIFSELFGLKTPEGISPIIFLLIVFISKIGTAIAITLLFYYSKSIFNEKWITFVLIWWVMFLFNELSQALSPNYSWIEAIAGIISESIYLPLSVIALKKILK